MSDPRLAPAAGQKRSAAQSMRPSYSHQPPPPPPPPAAHPHLVTSSLAASSSASCQSHARVAHQQPSVHQPQPQPQPQPQHRPQPHAEKKRAVSVHHYGNARRHSGNSSRYDDDDGSEQMDCGVRWERKEAQPPQTDSRRQQQPAAAAGGRKEQQQQQGGEVGEDYGEEEAVVALNPVTASLHVPHSWAEIVQKEKKRPPAAAAAASSASSRPPARSHCGLQPLGKPNMSSNTAHSSSSSSTKPVHRSPLSAAYFACLVPADKEQQKHVERAARHHHDISCHRDAVISVLSCILEQLFPNRDADVLPVDPALITMFHTERVPSISISCYLSRLAQYTECSSEVLIQSIIHINRILHHRPAFKINSLNIHRLLLTSLLCSAKFFDDQYYNNHFYAKVGGISNRELNELEIEFLALINFDLFVDFSVYRHFYAELGGDKLHQHCSCRYKEMPLFDADMYRMPKEWQGAEEWSGEDDKAEAEQETAEERDGVDKVRCSTYAAGEVKAAIGRHTPVQSSAAAGVPSSVSPSTTDSSSSDNDDDGTTAIESDDELEDAAAVNDKTAALSTAPPAPQRPVMDRQSSTSSVSRSMDGLAMDGCIARPAAQTSSTCCPCNQLPTSCSSSQPRVVAMSDSPPLPAHPGLTAAAKAQAQTSIIHEVSCPPPPRAPYPPPYISDYFPYSYVPHFCPPPPPPPAFAHLQYTRAPLLYPPPPPPPQLSQIVGAGGGGGFVVPHSHHPLHPHHVLHPFHAQSVHGASAQHHSPHSHAHAHHSQQLHAAQTPIVGSVM